MSVQLAHRNRRLAYAITALESSSFSLPIWLLFMTRQLGLSVTAAVALTMTRWVTMAICNVPTGALADRYGRVRLYRFGQLFYALSFVPLVTTKNLPILIVAQVLGGLFGSMTIGTMPPLVQDGHELNGIPEKTYKNYLSTDTVLSYAFRAVAGVFGAWLFTQNPKGPYYLEILVLLLAFGATLFLHEFRVERPSATSNRQHIKESFHYIRQNAFLVKLFASIILLVIASESFWTALQPYFTQRQVPTQYFGVLFGVIALTSALGAYLSRKLPKEVSGLKVITGIILLTVLSLLMAVINRQWLAPLAIIPAGLGFGFVAPTRVGNIQAHTNSKYQSTILSMSSLSYTGFYAIVSVLVGRYVDLFGTETMLRIILAQAIICLLLVSVISGVGRKTSNVSPKILKATKGK